MMLMIFGNELLESNGMESELKEVVGVERYDLF